MAVEHESSFNVHSFDAELAGVGSAADEVAGRDQTVAEAADAFRRDGCFLLNNVVDAGLIGRLYASYTKRHAGSGASGQPRGSLRVGHQRFMITIRLRPPFTDSGLYANPVLLGVLTELLGADRILFSFGAVVSHPGAEDQHVHSDGGTLFGDRTSEGSLPPYAVTVIVPLVEMNEWTGTTRVWPGSHRIVEEELVNVQPLDPVIRTGGALLMDYRLYHGGLANGSTRPRPILSLVFARPWFRDAVNFREQPPLLYGPVQRVRMPPHLRRLLPPDPGASIEERAAAIGRRVAAKATRRVGS